MASAACQLDALFEEGGDKFVLQLVGQGREALGRVEVQAQVSVGRRAGPGQGQDSGGVVAGQVSRHARAATLAASTAQVVGRHDRTHTHGDQGDGRHGGALEHGQHVPKPGTSAMMLRLVRAASLRSRSVSRAAVKAR